MISLGAVASASGAADYYSKDNYYTAGAGAGPSQWVGQGAAALGLTGSVDSTAFAALLAGELPDGTRIGAQRGEHRPGLDMTFSAPKSLSLVALVGGDARLVDAFQASVVSTLVWVERSLVEARGWDGTKQKTEKTGLLAAALFHHDVSRAVEPQLHTHAVIANATRTADGKWRAL